MLIKPFVLFNVFGFLSTFKFSQDVKVLHYLFLLSILLSFSITIFMIKKASVVELIKNLDVIVFIFMAYLDFEHTKQKTNNFNNK